LGRIPAKDATTTRLLKQAGAVLLGKLTTWEFAIGGTAFDTPFPPARNPWNIEHTPAGSSSGSGAAVAAGLCAMAMGSDTGGSIRWPAAWCGLAGLKPTYGPVSPARDMPLAFTPGAPGVDADQCPVHRRGVHAAVVQPRPRRAAGLDRRRRGHRATGDRGPRPE